jgi:hypothetical protein
MRMWVGREVGLAHVAEKYVTSKVVLQGHRARVSRLLGAARDYRHDSSHSRSLSRYHRVHLYNPNIRGSLSSTQYSRDPANAISKIGLIQIRRHENCFLRRITTLVGERQVSDETLHLSRIPKLPRFKYGPGIR